MLTAGEIMEMLSKKAGGGLSFRCHLWSFRFWYAAISTLRVYKETSSLMLESSTSLLVEAIKKKLLTCIDTVIQPMKPLKPTIQFLKSWHLISSCCSIWKMVSESCHKSSYQNTNLRISIGKYQQLSLVCNFKMVSDL